MKKTMAVILCAVIIALCVPPMTASAAESDIFIVSTGVEFVDQWNNAAAVKGTVKLDRDVSIANEYNLGSNRTLTIDLNGHIIKGVGDSADYIFNISDGGSLTVKDTSEAKSGKILVTKTDEDYEEIIIVNEGGKLTLDSGTLQGNGDEDCRIVDVESGTFIMNGGSVMGNTYNGDGAGIYINEGSFTMNGGSISDNHGDNSNDYGGAIYFDGSTDSRLVIRGGEIFGNSSYYGGAVYIDDGYAEFTGGKIYNNTARMVGAIEIADTANAVTLAGDLLVTGNKSVDENGNMTYMAAVNADDTLVNMFTDIYLGGRVRIYGNGLADFYICSNNLYVMDDIDISPENHAWVGIRANAEVNPISTYFKGKGTKDYTVCFFGTQVGNTYFEPLSFSYEGEPYKIGVLDDIDDVNEMKLNESGITDGDGNTLTKGVDYTMSYDSIMREYSITAKEPITLAEANSLFTNQNSDFDSTTTLVKTVTEESVFGTTYTYYYLSECYSYGMPYFYTTTTFDMIKQSYYTVKVFVEDLKFFKNCNVDENNFISGLMPGMTKAQFYENYVAIEGLEVLFNTTDKIGTGTELAVLYDGDNFGYSAVIFGDVNGDGWYDGTDAVIVNCIANGMFTSDDITEEQYIAADCNHDGVIDSLDVEILENAGVLLTQIDQSKSSDELLETSSAYVEYLSLIDQTVEAEETVVTEEAPTEEPEQLNWFQMVLAFLSALLELIYDLFTL